MGKYEIAIELNDIQFKRLTGVRKRTVAIMIEILQSAYNAKHKRRGRHSKLTIQNMLMLTLEYLRQYSTFLELGVSYGVAESTAHDIVVWVENTLVKSGKFSLQGKKFAYETEENDFD
jgi:hypothetical protein